MEQALHVVLQSSKCCRQRLACNHSAAARHLPGCLSSKYADVCSHIHDCVPLGQSDAMLEVAMFVLNLMAEECYIWLADVCNLYSLAPQSLVW